MIEVASLELCRELYELSRWFDPSHKYDENGDVVVWKPFTSEKHTPAYDLGYLLRKLPSHDTNDIPATYLLHCLSVEDFQAEWNGDINHEFSVTADTPEDAACKLAIELFKQGILR